MPFAPEAREDECHFAAQTTLRIHIMEQFTLSDPLIEKVLHDEPLFPGVCRTG
jgi:hypothetical protein